MRCGGGTVMAEQLVAVNMPPSEIAPEASGSATSKLLAATGLTLLGVVVLLAGVIVLANRPEWWRGLLAASVVSALAAGISLLPLIWGMRRGMYHRVAAWFVAAGLRALVSLGGCLLAVRMGGYPLAPTLLMMVVFYFGLLAAESACIARALWETKDQA